MKVREKKGGEGIRKEERKEEWRRKETRPGRYMVHVHNEAWRPTVTIIRGRGMGDRHGAREKTYPRSYTRGSHVTEGGKKDRRQKTEKG